MKTLSKLWAQIGAGWKVACAFFLALLIAKYALGYGHDERLILAALFAVCVGFQLIAKQAPNEKTDEKAAVTLEDESKFSYDLATEKARKHHGWDTWTVEPRKKMLVNEWCSGGPPTHTKIYEYEIRDETVLVRLIEHSDESFDSPRFEVFNGMINLSYLEKEYRRMKSEWGENSPLLEIPDTRRARLEKEIAWHEILGAARYVVLSVDTNNMHGDFFSEERERLSKAFEAIAGQATQMGAVWDEDLGWYQPPAAATKEEKDAIRSAIAELLGPEKLRKLNVEFVELRQCKSSLKVLTDALSHAGVGDEATHYKRMEDSNS